MASAFGLRFIAAGVAQRHDLLGIGADTAGEEAVSARRCRAPQQRFGDVAPADVGDLVRDYTGKGLGLGLGDRGLENDDVTAGQRRGVEMRVCRARRS